MSHHNPYCAKCEKYHDDSERCRDKDVKEAERLRQNPKERKYSFWDEIGGHT